MIKLLYMFNVYLGMREDSYISLSAQECFEEKGE